MTFKGDRMRIAVVFGGNSPEFDVSVVTAQQLMDAVDPMRFEIVPVLLDFENRFHSGKSLRDAARFRPLPPGLSEVSFAWGETGPELRGLPSGRATAIDCVIPACHGLFGEDGRLQGLLELVGVPYAGFLATNAAVAMRKDLTKSVVKAAGVPVLPQIVAGSAQLREPDTLAANVEEALGFPVIVKPASLGSSIGVGVANNAKELVEVVRLVLGKDRLAVIEPRVPNLVEYNIALRRSGNDIKFSAVERPRPQSELLDFKEKYLSGAQSAKGSGPPSQGMLSLTREINPKMDDKMLADIRLHASRSFEALGARGCPRLDFLCNAKTGELWFNEINPIPGSFGFFLWERAAEPILFPELIEHLVDEALATSLKTFDDPVPEAARLLPRQ